MYNRALLPSTQHQANCLSSREYNWLFIDSAVSRSMTMCWTIWHNNAFLVLLCPQCAIIQSRATFNVLISCDIKSLTWYGYDNHNGQIWVWYTIRHSIPNCSGISGNFGWAVGIWALLHVHVCLPKLQALSDFCTSSYCRCTKCFRNMT